MNESAAEVRFLRRPEVVRVTGLSTPKLYRLIAEGLFPKGRKYTCSRGVFWLESEIVAWQETQLEGE